MSKIVKRSSKKLTDFRKTFSIYFLTCLDSLRGGVSWSAIDLI
jgi:hypothetical protein